jgi:hypothetical protein
VIHPNPTRKTLLNPSPVAPARRKRIERPSFAPQSPTYPIASQPLQKPIFQMRDQVNGISKRIGQVEKCVNHACQTYELWEHMQNEIRQRKQVKQAGNQRPFEWLEALSRIDLHPWERFMRSPETIDFLSYIARRRDG